MGDMGKDLERIVSFELLGQVQSVTVTGVDSNKAAKEFVMDKIAKSLEFRSVIAVKPRPRQSVLSTYIDGFRWTRKTPPAQ